ncbi:quinohemoprotein amine dehydrogenase beta subunit [Primorskyibacter sedentarius]|uniref:Quinohemoprotein amine dehydrogenase beta subunit n=2 Tax=Primorskyibacter sedentarius TaxID=745311 RepID=A0A4R3J3K7_9RHOB|nr:quinohemoprotein amine dehydrogenase beta subunit [Primorskyibacter sedentarius]
MSLMKLPNLAFLCAAASFSLAAAPLSAKDYILAPARPDKLVIVDAEAMTVDKVITLEDAGPTPMVPVVDEAGQFAYVTINKSESIAKVDLTTGETVARRDLSTADTRIKTMFGMDLAPDGSQLAVFETPVKLMTSHYEVQPTRISLVDTRSLETVKTFEVPRQITVVMFSTDGSRIYGLGRQMHVFDAETGEHVDDYPIQDWKTDSNYYPSDVLDAWSQFETSDMLVTPFYTARSDMSLEDPEAYRTGLLTMDLRSGEMQMRDVRSLDVFYFSTAANPDRTRAYGAYNVLESFDLTSGEPIKRVPLPHSYYSVNVSSDGQTVWLGGALSDLAAYDAETLEKKGQVDMPDGAAMSLASIRIFQREE